MPYSDFCIDTINQEILRKCDLMMTPFSRFSRKFEEAGMDEGDTIKVPIIRDFVSEAKTKKAKERYEGVVKEADFVPVTLGERLYVACCLPQELKRKAMRVPNAEQVIAEKTARNLVLKVYADFFAQLTAANVPTVIWSGSGDTFGFDDIRKIWKEKVGAFGSECPMDMILNTCLWAALLDEDCFKQNPGLGEQVASNLIQRGVLPGQVLNMNIAHAELLPDIGEQLAGLMIQPDAIAFACTGVDSMCAVGTGGLTAYEQLVHAESGLPITYRQICEANPDIRQDIWEVRTGFNFLDTDKICRIVDTDIAGGKKK